MNVLKTIGRKGVAVGLSLALCLSMALPAFAEGETEPENNTTEGTVQENAAQEITTQNAPAANQASTEGTPDEPAPQGDMQGNQPSGDESAPQADQTPEEKLQELINNAENGATIVMTENVDGNIVIPVGKNIVFDLAGYTLNGGTNNGSHAALTNKGTVVIKDSGETGTIKREDVGADGTYYTVVNEGDMTIEGGTITNNSGVGTRGSSLVINYNNQGKEGGYGGNQGVKMTIKGGHLEQQNFIALKADPNTTIVIEGGEIISGTNATNFYGDVTIKEGTVVFKGDILVLSHKNSEAQGGNEYAGSFKIEGGTVSCNSIAVWNGWSGGKTDSAPELSITDGDVTLNGIIVRQVKDNGTTSNVDEGNGASASITGGTFSKDVSTFVGNSEMTCIKVDSEGNTYEVGVLSSIDDPSSGVNLYSNAGATTATLPAPDFKVNGKDVDPTLIEWTSDNPDVVTVKDGVITVVGNGNATITATVNGKTVTYTVGISTYYAPVYYEPVDTTPSEVEIDDPDTPLAALPEGMAPAEPEEMLTRGKLISILHWMDGEVAAELSSFIDVAADSDLAVAIGWAQSNGITKGVSETEFAPQQTVTLGQLAAFLNRYAAYVGSDVTVELNGDEGEVLTWAEAEEIINAFFTQLNA